MNKYIGSGRWTRDTEIRYSGEMAIGRNTLAVDRGKDKNGEDRGTDFLSCVSFGKTAEALEKYGRKGAKMLIEAHVQTGSYDREDGTKVYTTDFVIDRWEFAESKGAEPQANRGNGFADIDANIEEELPFA